jgi:hypothetical protein
LVHLTSATGLAIYAVEHIPGIPATKEKKVRGLLWCDVSQQRHGQCVADGIEEIFPGKTSGWAIGVAHVGAKEVQALVRSSAHFSGWSAKQVINNLEL